MNLSDLIHLLGDSLGAVITTQESPEVFALEERIRLASKARREGDPAAWDQLQTAIDELDAEQARAVATAFTVYFDLVNLAEEIDRIQHLRQTRRNTYPAPIDSSIAAAIAQFKAHGLAAEALQTVLHQLEIELVLTAHPTEAKRRTVLSKLQRISQLLEELLNPHCLPGTAHRLKRAILAEITSLWLTSRARTERPAVTDEVRTGLYFVDEIFWDALPALHADLHTALADHYPGVFLPKNWIRLASWIGGDRDGNPNVTVDVTAETLRLHRGLAIEKHRRALNNLARSLSMSARRLPPSLAFNQWLEARRPYPPHVSYLENRYTDEPYRLALSLLGADLAWATQEDMVARLLAEQPATARIASEQLSTPLNLIQQIIPEVVASDELNQVIRQVEIFGLHTARLDLREDSSRLNNALGETLRALNISLDFSNLPDSARTNILLGLLEKPAPHLATHPGFTPESAETWALFQLIRRTQQVYGSALLGPFIISMTRGAADILAVLLMAHWAGCAAGLQITPLFETVADLNAAPRILTDLFDLPAYRQHLESCRGEQMVMIGYSDSNKDGGYLSANWALYQGQERVAQICAAHAVRLTLFHGRGGSVARGGGPAHRAIQAQPPGTLNGRFRVTEQGEAIAARYAHPELAHRHLEQVVSAVLLASVPHPGQSTILPAWHAVMQKMAHTARAAYRLLVYETPGFSDYWRSASPLEEISRLRIGSRPTARSGGEIQVTNVRAIPWVFSWMQNRHTLPGWYGVGTALAAIQSPQLLREMYAGWPFFQVLLDNTEMTLLKADMQIAAQYATLVPDAEQAERIYGDIRDEFDRTTEQILNITGASTLLERDPALLRSIRLRNPYIDPLNYIQVETLRRLRSLPPGDSPEAAGLREVIHLTINGIAAGLRNTG